MGPNPLYEVTEESITSPEKQPAGKFWRGWK